METLVTSNAELNASVGFLGKVALARPTYRSVYDNADKIMRRSISYFPHRVIFSFPLKHATLSTAKKDSRDQSRGARFVVSLSLFLLLPLLFSFSLSLSLSPPSSISPLSFICSVVCMSCFPSIDGFPGAGHFFATMCFQWDVFQRKCNNYR